MRIASRLSAPVMAETVKIACQPKVWKMKPPSGRPTPAPMPMVPLISAIAPGSFSGGIWSRMMLMPIGIRAMAKPCRIRATSICGNVVPKVPISEPTMRTARLTIIILRLPYISANFAADGIDTELAMSVAVISQLACSGVQFSRPGRSGSSGMNTVCMIDTTAPLTASTPMMAFGAYARVFTIQSLLGSERLFTAKYMLQRSTS